MSLAPAGPFDHHFHTMYQPPPFREDRIEVLHELIRTHPLGLLISAGPGGLLANPLPFLVDAGRGPHGRLRAHLARPNPQIGDLAAVDTCLIVFQGPQHYITPSWYATKHQTGKVVPTWNYVTVQVRGRPAIIDDEAWLRRLLNDLTERHERHLAAPWSIDDAPAPFVAGQIKGIVGLEIPIDRIDGKWKVSQNRPASDRAGVAAGLGEGDDRARALAALVTERGKPDRIG